MLGSSALDRTGSLPLNPRLHQQTSNDNLRRTSLPGNRQGGHEYRRSSIPAHMQHGGGYNPSAGHGRRSSVVDIAADFLGPQATENLAHVRQVSSRMEDAVDGYTRPIRPYLPGLGRFLIVVTFLEDALRILTQISGEFSSVSVHARSEWCRVVEGRVRRLFSSLCCIWLPSCTRYNCRECVR